MNLIKFTAVMQYAVLVKMIWNTNKETFKDFFFLEFNKGNSVFLINVLQETFVNSIKVFESKTHFTSLFQLTMSCSIHNYYIF
jgi:hypothetical protein